MAGATIGDNVKFHFVIKDKKGKIFDQSEEKEPEEIVLGEGSIPSGIEVSLVGMSEGDSKTVDLKPNMHFGPRVEDLVIDVEIGQFPDDLKLEKGAVLEYGLDDGTSELFTIASIGDEMVKLDGNHPLAGQDVTVDLKVLVVES
ncbi:MAG: FKBP-type peptidyl-prolyl cis-trans isomerase SlyD [Chlamydiae bacterium]|nr:FKBP-type peptidyl-prolyl cis-trans isomerase SlyD [Chlamydiota bacterium]